MGDILGDDELEEMRLRDNEDAEQAGNHVEAISAKSATMPDVEQQEQEQQSKPLQPPPGFSANHLFGDVDDDDPLDLVTNLSFLNDTEEVRPGLFFPQDGAEARAQACFETIPCCCQGAKAAGLSMEIRVGLPTKRFSIHSG